MFEKTKTIIIAAKKVTSEAKSLRYNLQQLSQAGQSATAFTHDVQRAIDRFEFKTQPRLDKINELIKKMKR